MNKTETSGFSEPNITTSAFKATIEAVCHHPIDWFRLIGTHRIFGSVKKYTYYCIFKLLSQFYNR